MPDHKQGVFKAKKGRKLEYRDDALTMTMGDGTIETLPANRARKFCHCTVDIGEMVFYATEYEDGLENFHIIFDDQDRFWLVGRRAKGAAAVYDFQHAHEDIPKSFLVFSGNLPVKMQTNIVAGIFFGVCSGMPRAGFGIFPMSDLPPYEEQVYRWPD